MLMSWLSILLTIFKIDARNEYNTLINLKKVQYNKTKKVKNGKKR
jgi:hypothetical protein